MTLQFQEARKCPDTTAGSERAQNKWVMCVWGKTELSLSPGWVYCPTCGNDSNSACHLNLRRLLTDQLWRETVKCIVFQSMLALLAWPASVLHCYVPRHKPCKNWVLLQKLFKLSKTSQNPKCISVCTVYSRWTWFSIPFTCYPMNGQIYPKCPSPWAPWWVTLGSYLEKLSAQLWRGHWGREGRKGEEMTPSSREGGYTALQTQIILASALCSGNPRLVPFRPFRNIDPDHSVWLEVFSYEYFCCQRVPLKDSAHLNPPAFQLVVSLPTLQQVRHPQTHGAPGCRIHRSL